jgi:hypothetical protein
LPQSIVAKIKSEATLRIEQIAADGRRTGKALAENCASPRSRWLENSDDLAI